MYSKHTKRPIVVRSPLRISFAGGGTDLRAFWEREQGCVVSITISPSLTVRVDWDTDAGVNIAGELPERCTDAEALSNCLIRETLAWFGVRTGITISIDCPVKPGSGLGTSSALVCALVQALSVSVNKTALPPRELAELASIIEIERAGRPIGKQDHYACAVGGFNSFEFFSNGSVEATPVSCRPEFRSELEGSMLLLSTGMARDAGQILAKTGISSNSNAANAARLVKIRDAAYAFRRCIEAQELMKAGKVVLDAWHEKRALATIVSVPVFDELLDLSLKAGAYGGKLLGAGAGGHALILAPPETHRLIVKASGLPMVPFCRADCGVQVLDPPVRC